MHASFSFGPSTVASYHSLLPRFHFAVLLLVSFHPPEKTDHGLNYWLANIKHQSEHCPIGWIVISRCLHGMQHVVRFLLLMKPELGEDDKH
jgi:hypothetical protein